MSVVIFFEVAGCVDTLMSFELTDSQFNEADRYFDRGHKRASSFQINTLHFTLTNFILTAAMSR